MLPISIHTLMLSIHAVAKERQAVGVRLANGDYEDDQSEELNDDLDQLTKAIGELAALYERQREGCEGTYPATEKILALYD